LFVYIIELIKIVILLFSKDISKINCIFIQNFYGLLHHVKMTESILNDDDSSVMFKEQVLRILLNISNATVAIKDLRKLMGIIREELGKLMDSTNFYLALYHPEDDTFTMPYFSDLKDHFERVPARKTLSKYVVKTGKTILVRQPDFEDLVKKGEVTLVGTDSKVWMGAPLRVNDRIIGMIGLQSYSDENTYTDADKNILELVAHQIGLAIDRKQKEEELEIEKTYFEQLFRNVPEATVIQEYPGIITDVNVAFTKLFGFKPQELIGKSLDKLIVPEEMMQEAYSITRRTFEGEAVELETIRKKKNGKTLEVSLTVTPFRISPDKTIMYTIYRDISKKKEVERKLVTAKEKAEEADRLKTAFLTNMSHEIRTPMNAIMGFAQLLSSANLTPENKTEYVNIIKNSGDSLLRLIDDILDLAKLESGQVVIREEITDVHEMMESLYLTFSRLITEKQLELRYKRYQDKPSVNILTDPIRLRQILTNLLSNAIKFTHEGYVEFGYNISVPDNVLVFFVKDTGIGIPQDKMEIIFNRFQQVDNSKTRLYPGTGLGLAISKHLTELLGGRIWVESELNKGSSFYFTIPYKALPDEEMQKIDDLNEGNLNLSGKNILIVEDDEYNYLYLHEILQQAGVNVYHAVNGREAIHFVKEKQGENIDLVLMDIEMPEVNGYEATAYIKKEFPRIPVIAQTAYASMEEKTKCLQAGCDAYLAKPLQINDLIDEIKKYI